MATATLDIRTFLPQSRYAGPMGKRTSLIVDPPLLEQAEEALATKGPTATVREALERVVRQAHLDRLAQLELPDDFAEQLERMRQPRTFDFE